MATVVHYDVARSVDGFVHRSGRTAVSQKLQKVLKKDDEDKSGIGLESPIIQG